MGIMQSYATWMLIALLLRVEEFYKCIANDVERWFDTSNYDKNDKRPLHVGVNKKVLGMFKDELGGKFIKKFVRSEQIHMHTYWKIVANIKKRKEQ